MSRLETAAILMFSSSFFSAAERSYLGVKDWTRNVNIFEKDFLIVPINKKYHWYLAIICYPYLLQPDFEKVGDTGEDENKSEDSQLSKWSDLENSAGLYTFTLAIFNLCSLGSFGHTLLELK